jgi:hypothetical protein
MRYSLTAILPLLCGVLFVNQANADWYFVAPKSHPIYRGDASEEPQLKPLQKLSSYVGDELSIELLTGWFGAPQKTGEGIVSTPKGFLFSRLLYRAPLAGAIGPKEIYEQYVFDVDSVTKIYFLRSRGHDDTTWRSLGYFAAIRPTQTSDDRASDEGRNAWEMGVAKSLLALLKNKKAEQDVEPDAGHAPE